MFGSLRAARRFFFSANLRVLCVSAFNMRDLNGRRQA